MVASLFASLKANGDEAVKEASCPPSQSVERENAGSPVDQLTWTWSSSSAEETSAPPATATKKSLMLPHRQVLYVNLVCLNALNAIDQQIQREYKDIPKPLHQLASQLVNTWATPERVAEAMSTELPTSLVEKLSLHGVKAVAETTFWEGPFLVVQVQIHSVSPTVSIEAQAKDFYDELGDLEQEACWSEGFALRVKACLQSILFLLGMRTKQAIENNVLPRIIQSNMERIMQEGVTSKMKRRGLHGVVKVLTENKQARYFFDTLRRVRQAHRPFANFEESFTSIHEETKTPGDVPLVFEKKLV